MSKKEPDSKSLQAKRGSAGSGDRRRSGASADSTEALAGGERRVSRTSCSSAGDHSLSSQSQQQQPSPAATKKVLFSDPPATTVSNESSAKRLSQIGQALEHQSSQGEEDSPKTQKKAISTWKMACGMTKDKTKDLLKRWRTLPDHEVERPPLQELKANTAQGDHGWSVHVWATWVKRCPSEDEPGDSDKDKEKSSLLTDTQKEKLTHFFAHVFDMDRDDIISLQDIEGFTEGANQRLHEQNEMLKNCPHLWKLIMAIEHDETCAECLLLKCPPKLAAKSATSSLSILSTEEYFDQESISWLEDDPNEKKIGRLMMNLARKDINRKSDSIFTYKIVRHRLKHYTEWSSNSGEYLVLQQVQQGLVETFIYPLKPDNGNCAEGVEVQQRKDLDRLFLSIEEWLNIWGGIVGTKKNFHEMPLWLQYFPKILFTAINKSGTGRITKDELSTFYSSVMGYPSQKLNSLVKEAYDAMTARGDFKLTYDCYRLSFANFLFGRYPNGPGQFVFGASQRKPSPTFPVDYSAMNTPPEDIEPYGTLLKSNRTSIIV